MFGTLLLLRPDSSFFELSALKRFDLETLDISNNPLEGDLTVEAFCMLGCPQLTHLNGQAVSDVARARARTWCDESDAGRAIAEYVSYYVCSNSKSERICF